MKLDYNLINSVNKNDSHNKPSVTVIEDCWENYDFYEEENKNNPKAINIILLEYENEKGMIKRGDIFYDGSDMKIKSYTVPVYGLNNIVLNIGCDI